MSSNSFFFFFGFVFFFGLGFLVSLSSLSGIFLQPALGSAMASPFNCLTFLLFSSGAACLRLLSSSDFSRE